MSSRKEPLAQLALRVTPRAHDDAVLGWEDDSLRVRVQARAEDGKANEAVRRLLAQRLRLSVSAIVIDHGARSRRKLVKVYGIDDAELRKRLIQDA